MFDRSAARFALLVTIFALRLTVAEIGAAAGPSTDPLHGMPPAVLDRLSPTERRALEVMTPEQTLDVLEGADPASIELASGESLARFLAREAGADQDLVYSPLPPCRLVDTRNAGGALLPGVARGFNARGPNLSAQGGNVAGCSVPLGPLFGGSADAARSLVLHVVAVAPTGIGFLRAWPGDGTRPFSSFLNYAAIQNASPSTSTVLDMDQRPTCPAGQTCFDFLVEASTSSTHLVVDVVGYFRPHTSHYGQTWTGGSPLALSLQGPDATLQLRNTNDALGAFAKNTWSSLQFGLFNPGSTASGSVPPATERSFFGFDSVGRVGSLTNSGGGPVFRNLLDDGNGNTRIQGNLEARNMPGIAFDQQKAPVIATGNGSVTLANITVNVRSAGVLHVQAFASAQGCSLVEIVETTNGIDTVLVGTEEVDIGFHATSTQIARAVSPGDFSFQLRGHRRCNPGSTEFTDRHLSATYIPNPLG
jgi:hypothetical protein